MNYNFVKPRTPQYNKGLLVIESDDGYVADYSVWLPRAKQKIQEHSQWINSQCVVANSAVNTDTIGNDGMLSISNLHELIGNGWEILSHGKYHTGLGKLEVTEGVSAGATSLKVRGAGQIRIEALYDYQITEGDKSEIIKFIAPDPPTGTFSEEYMELAQPLINNYTIAATIELTDESAHDLLQGCVDDLKSWGINCKHHVFTYHTGSQHQFSQKAINWINEYFMSARGQSGSTNDISSIDLNNLKCLLSTSASLTQLADLLDDTALNNKLFIYYGHGETSESALNKLDYLIDGALNRGIRIVTRSKAIELFK